MSLTTVSQPIPRDRWGRPLVAGPQGGKPVAYSRCTTFIDCIEDKYNLQKWMQRQVALGLASRADLLLSVSAHRDDKRELDRICDAAREAAAASAAATTGTALHALTETLDRGGELPALPAGAQASIDAYREAMAGVKIRGIEQFVVQDKLQVAGTFDRLVQVGKTRYIADIKTGSVDFGALKIAMQMAIYSRSTPYTVEKGRGEPTGADFNRGLLIHLPAVDDPEQARCELRWVDLKRGWDAVLLAKQVREARKVKATDIYEPFVTTEPSTTDQIAAAATPDAVRALWTPEWTDDLLEVAKARVAELEAS